MYSGSQAEPNSVDPDLTPHNSAPDQGLLCLSFIKKFLITSTGNKSLVQMLGQL